MKRLIAATLAFGIPLALAACGDNKSPGDTDAASADIDAKPIDAQAIDAQAIDAPPAETFSGTVSFQEAKLLNPGASGTFFGQGIQASISFASSNTGPGPIMEEQPGSPLGCKAWSYTTAQAGAVAVGVDEGPITFSTTAGTTPPSVPACVFTAGVGYTCPEIATLSTGGTIAVITPGMTASLTDADVTYSDANSVGRYVNITGAAIAGNNGAFPIVARPAAGTIVYASGSAAIEILPGTATHINLAAVGPTPGVADPGFLNNDVALTVNHAAGGGNHIAAFTSTTGAGTVGDDFQMVHNEIIKLNAIPADGSAFTIACDAANCGTASGSLINIVTTDASLTGLSPFALPLPATKRIQIRCASLGATMITVPAAYSALLMTSGATRIQSTFIRPTLMSGGPATVNVISGHAIVGYTTR